VTEVIAPKDLEYTEDQFRDAVTEAKRLLLYNDEYEEAAILEVLFMKYKKSLQEPESD
jgi:hypothetical protein